MRCLSYPGVGSGLVRGVPFLGDSGSGMREGVISRSKGEWLDLMGLSLSSDLRYQWLFEDRCQAGGAQGPSDSASLSSCSWGGMLQRDECMLERVLKMECVLRSGSKASSEAVREGMSCS